MKRATHLTAVFTATILGAAGDATAGWRITDLGTLGGPTSYANAINAAGQVAGGACPSSNCPFLFRGFLYGGGVMTALPTLGGPDSASANGINDSGDVVGSAQAGPPDYGYRAFLYRDGNIRDLGTLGGSDSTAIGINASRAIVGSSKLKNDTGQHAFVYTEPFGMVDLGVLAGKTSSVATAIANNGTIVGVSYNGSGSEQAAFRYLDGTMTALGTLGGTTSIAYSLNETGDIVGTAALEDDTAQHAFVWRTGVFTDLGTLDRHTNSVALDVNNGGQIVGYSWSATKGDLAFLYSSGNMISLTELPEVQGAGWRALTEARSINDSGEIVGSGENAAGEYRAFLLTPVPEPTTGSLALLGLATLSIVNYRTRSRRRLQVGTPGGGSCLPGRLHPLVQRSADQDLHSHVNLAGSRGSPLNQSKFSDALP